MQIARHLSKTGTGRLAMECFDLTVLDGLPDIFDGTIERARAFPELVESPGMRLQEALAVAPSLEAITLLPPVTKKQQRVQKAAVSVAFGIPCHQIDVGNPHQPPHRNLSYPIHGTEAAQFRRRWFICSHSESTCLIEPP